VSPSRAAKTRIDQLLVEKGLVESRQKAQALILAGKVIYTDPRTGAESRVEKPGIRLDSEIKLRIKGLDHPYVSRGGMKLKAALDAFQIEVTDKIALDIGASTGGFTSCLLQEGAQAVLAVDVGTNQLHWELRKNPKVISLEQKDFRKLRKEDVDPRFHEVDLTVVDVSFCSLRKIMPSIPPFIAYGSMIIALVKPQFEVEAHEVGKKGVVRDSKLHERVIAEVKDTASNLGWEVAGVIASPIKGPEGNQEFLICCRSPVVRNQSTN
jgi:23S rRNA (cytidine1920-2'-O)/16S rRNA (cytidine1409-2'-O)-methyltransferase